MNDVDFVKRDMTVAYGDRTFALRAYRAEGTWHGLVIETKTPLRTALAPAADAATGFAAAVHFVSTAVEAGSTPIPAR